VSEGGGSRGREKLATHTRVKVAEQNGKRKDKKNSGEQSLERRMKDVNATQKKTRAAKACGNFPGNRTPSIAPGTAKKGN